MMAPLTALALETFYGFKIVSNKLGMCVGLRESAGVGEMGVLLTWPKVETGGSSRERHEKPIEAETLSFTMVPDILTIWSQHVRHPGVYSIENWRGTNRELSPTPLFSPTETWTGEVKKVCVR